jgi:hypothetical protein
MKWNGFGKTCSAFNRNWKKLNLSRLFCLRIRKNSRFERLRRAQEVPSGLR